MLISAIKTLDTSLFLFINTFYHSSLLDWFFLFFSFYPLIIWGLIGLVVAYVGERKDKTFLLRLFLALFLSGLAASVIIKPIIRRPRPDITHGNKVNIVVEKPAAVPFNNDFAFPSGHAAIAYAGAYVLVKEVKNRQKLKRKHKIAVRLLYILAFITAFSRIYLGKHYPLDVIFGAVLGISLGWVSEKMIDYIYPKAVISS